MSVWTYGQVIAEVIHWGEGEFYFCCTNGGQKQLGQVMKLVPSADGKQDKLQLFLESEDKNLYNFGDNLTVCPNGHLLVCEDQYTDIIGNRIFEVLTAVLPHEGWNEV